MMLVLTYHKVMPPGEADPDFYTVPVDRFERQLDLLQRNGFEFLDPSTLLSGSAETTTGRKPCLLTFDDGTVDHQEWVLPVLARKNCRALFFVPTAKLNQPGCLTSEAVREIARAGHAVGSHSHEHRRMDRLPEEDVRVQIERSMELLASSDGVRPKYFAPPGGFITPLVRATALECGATVIRTMRWGYNHRLALADMECAPINRYTSAEEFTGVMEGRSRRLAYVGKELAKKLIPAPVYESLRRALAGKGH